MNDDKFELLLAKYVAGALDGPERDEFLSEVETDSNRRAAMLRELSTEAALRKASSKVKGQMMHQAAIIHPDFRQPAPQPKTLPWPWAAAVFFCVALGLFFLVRRPDTPRTPEGAPPVQTDDDKVAPEAVKPASFNSEVELTVFRSVDGRYELLGSTPSWQSGGVPVPADDSWHISYEARERDDAERLAADILEQNVPGVSVGCYNQSPKVREKCGFLIARLRNARNLRWLSVAGYEPSLRDIAALTRLRHLSVDVAKATEDELKLLGELKELRSLRVRATISAPIMRLLAAASLETLDLQGSTMMPGVLTELAKSTTLEHLDLTDIKGDLSGLRATLARIPNLKTVWLGDHFEVLPALAELRQSIPAVQVNGHPAYRENEPSREEIVKEALARYSAELNDPTMEEGARDRSVGQRMKRRISYDWVDTPLPAALQSIENQCGVAIVIDPAVSDFPSITLRVTEMTCDLALDWILRLADMQYLIRGQAIIVTSQQKLLRRALTKELAVEGAQGRAWTQEELGLLARAIETLPLVRESGVDGEVFRRTGVATGSVPGGIKIEGTAYAMAHIERFVEDFVNVKPPVYVAPAWIGRIDAALDKKLDLQREKLGSVIEALSRETGLKIVLSPKITDTHRVVSASGTAREVLEQIAQQAQLTVQYLPHALFVSRDLMPQTVPYVFSVESALKAGISPEDLLAAIRTMAEESKAEFVPVLIRDRCIGSFDLWTFKRVVQMLEQSVAARKLTIPAAPWFFATYKNKGAPAAPPPQERGIDRGSGAAVPDSPQDE